MLKFLFFASFAVFSSVHAQQDSVKSNSPSFPIQLQNYRVIGKSHIGTASVYSSHADGNRTANGEKFNNRNFTAANNTFPLNTWLKVTNFSNKKSVIVRVTDRTSQKKQASRIILSRAAARYLAFLQTGTAKIKIEKILFTDSNSMPISKLDTNHISKSALPVYEKLHRDSFEIKGEKVFGIASFYSANLDGTKTATGDRYRNNLLTAASNHFKLNTWVLVTNLKNQKSVVVLINDRMHPRMKQKGRVVDLSRLAAQQLDFMEHGLTKVKVETIKLIASLDSVLIPNKSSLADSIRFLSDSTTKKDSITTASNKPARKVVLGIASFYSTNLDGTKTATGEIYRNQKMSAASNDFKLNSWVRVTNLKNNKSIILRINDRMHLRMQKSGRVVDLSRIAANRLDFIKKGVTKVKVEWVPKGTLE